ncbi:carboxyltransferase domain-containing protein [Paraburkholderia sp. EG287A]|uniref:carboxyltransferase domain-containing protein n=1 Tax=Paraburkholderia sp. EG287A TaxID=3237012 RepID=UPI0034D23A9F
MNTVRIFVYGTLKRGQRQDLARYSPAPVFLGEGWVSGRLYDLGHCPALVLDEAAGPVFGEVWALEAELFEALDRYEAECGDFHLSRGAVHTHNGTEEMVIYEIGAKEKLPSEPMPGGRWPAERGFELESITPLGDQAVLVSFPPGGEGAAFERAIAFANAVRRAAHPAVVDVVEAPASVAVHYRPHQFAAVGGAPHAQMTRFLRTLVPASGTKDGSTHVVPVCYAEELAPDLAGLAEASGLSREAFIRLHGSADYTVISVGFLPGFAYMAGLAPELRFPRLATPRTSVPAGSVAIAEDLCGVYPETSPGGWRLVGRTPFILFDAQRAAPNLFSPGDKVRFQQISIDEFKPRT